VPQRRRPLAQPGGQHLVELGQRPHGRVREAGHGLRCRAAQPDHDGDRLVVVEQQGRQPGSCAQPVPAADAGDGMDRVAQVTQP
jgi:hypothetical protein